MILRRTYFSLKEIIHFIENEIETTDTTPVGYLNGFISTHNASLEENGFYYNYGENVFNSLFNKVLYILLNDHDSDYFYFVDTKIKRNSEELELDDDIVIEALKRLVATYQATQEKYLLLLGLYDANKTKLLDAIERVQQNYFNDTPQNYGDFTNTSHLTTYNKSVETNDLTSLINRLDDIQNKYRNLLGDWANEFKTLFYFSE